MEVSIDGAEQVLLNITGGPDLSLFEAQTASEIVTDAASSDVNIIFGTSINENLEDEVVVTVIATGIDKKRNARKTVKKPASNGILNNNRNAASNQPASNSRSNDPLADWDITTEMNGNSHAANQRDNFQDVEKKDFNVFGSDSSNNNFDQDDDDNMPPFLRHRRK